MRSRGVIPSEWAAPEWTECTGCTGESRDSARSRNSRLQIKRALSSLSHLVSGLTLFPHSCSSYSGDKTGSTAGVISYSLRQGSRVLARITCCTGCTGVLGAQQPKLSLSIFHELRRSLGLLSQRRPPELFNLCVLDRALGKLRRKESQTDNGEIPPQLTWPTTPRDDCHLGSRFRLSGPPDIYSAFRREKSTVRSAIRSRHSACTLQGTNRYGARLRCRPSQLPTAT